MESSHFRFSSNARWLPIKIHLGKFLLTSDKLLSGRNEPPTARQFTPLPPKGKKNYLPASNNPNDSATSSSEDNFSLSGVFPSGFATDRKTPDREIAAVRIQRKPKKEK